MVRGHLNYWRWDRVKSGFYFDKLSNFLNNCNKKLVQFLIPAPKSLNYERILSQGVTELITEVIQPNTVVARSYQQRMVSSFTFTVTRNLLPWRSAAGTAIQFSMCPHTRQRGPKVTSLVALLLARQVNLTHMSRTCSTHNSRTMCVMVPAYIIQMLRAPCRPRLGNLAQGF
jgi:hypothetical protein